MATQAQETSVEVPQEQEQQEEELMLTLHVTPPSTAVDAPATIRLDQVSPADTVLSLRQLLAEYPSLACFTCYRLELQSSETNEWTPLNDFVELGEYESLADGSTLRMVLEKYTARKVRAHVRRFRDALANPPIPTASSEQEPEANGDDVSVKKGEDTSSKKDEIAKKESENKDKEKKEVTEEQLEQLREIHKNLEGISVPVETNLGDFYNPTEPQKDPNANAELPTCVKSIVFSGYNPPPGPRKLAGDLLYLEVTTTDDLVHFITAHVDGFFVNRSTLSSFDPRMSKNGKQCHLLLDVLKQASDKFSSAFASLLDRAAELAKQGPASIEWMVAAGNNVGGKAPWNTPIEAASKHDRDLNRAEDDLCATYGMDERGVLRDWNEEYQCCRELPASNPKEQLVRSRVMYKIVSEFVEAATQGAVAIVEGHLPPINPMDDESAHVYVFNNIFFSLSIDGKRMSKDAGGEEAAYSAANRDLQGVKALNEVDVEGLHTLATTVVDYLGMRVIAQSLIPGILQGEAASKLIYGSVDGGKTVASNDKMHQLMLQAGEKLHLTERKVQPLGKDEGEEEQAAGALVADSGAGGEAGTDVVPICGPVDAKGILGSDNRMYVLDLVRIAPKDATYYDVPAEDAKDVDGLRFARDDEGYVALLRPELVQLYTMWKQGKIRKEKLEAKKAEQEGAEDGKDESKEEEIEVDPINVNANVWMKYDASIDAEEVKKDEETARDAAEYLQKVVIPAFVADMRRGAINPADGRSLTELFHSCGINMRYLGRIASLAQQLETVGAISKYVLELMEVEMLARVSKHVLNDFFNAHEGLRSAPGDMFVQFLNAVLGTSTEVEEEEKPKAKKNKKNKKKKSKQTNGHAASLTPDVDVDSIWTRLEKEVHNRFGYDLTLWKKSVKSEDQVTRTHKVMLLRRLCQRLGLRVQSRTYDFTSASPFAATDLTGVSPVVKTSLPDHPYQQAKELLERGRMRLSNGALAEAYELLQEAANLLYQVCGGAHEDAALCSTSLATVLYHAGDVQGAIAQQQRALALYTQLEGMDYHDTAFAHANLALFLHANAQTDLAVSHMRRSIYLLEMGGGPHFPEVSSLYSKMGMMCQDVGHITLALFCHRESLRRGELGRLQVANTLHQMALACGLAGGFREALAYEKKVYAMYKEMLGDEDPRVVESAQFMEKFTEKAVEGAKGRRQVDAAAAADAIAKELLDEVSEEGGKKKQGKKVKANGSKKH